METLSLKAKELNKSWIFILDIIAISVIYFTPTVSHILNLPLYLFEPMRILLILSIAHTNKLNSYILAISLPFFSFLISGHPVLPKVAIIALELMLNVWIFYRIRNSINNSFLAMLTSIFISKAVYYLIKFAFISFLLFDSTLISTPIYIQVITTLFLSGYIFLILRRKE